MSPKTLCVVFAIAGCGVPTARKPEPAYAFDLEEDAPARRERTVIEFEDAVVDGALVAPSGALVVSPRTTSTFRDEGVNPMIDPTKDALSTLAIDVDTGSWTIARKFLDGGSLPPRAAVRVEEFVNYFPFAYPAPTRDEPLAAAIEVAPNPWTPSHQIVRVGLKAREIDADRRPAHLVFLVDVSGSMDAPDKLPLAKRSLRWMVDHLGVEDTVALVTYAGSTREVLAPTPVTRRAEIHEAIEALGAGGSTAMGDGLGMAYRLAEATYLPGAENRVIVLSDGDANVGPATHDALLQRIAHYAQRGITLSTVGFGTGNDTLMEQLADKGDGNYAYIDDFDEAKRAFGAKLTGTVHTVARDVKVQVAWDPAAVAAWRLIGYENRAIADADFRDDRVDAGEIGSGQTVTAVYDVVLHDGATRLGELRWRAKPPGPDVGAIERVVALRRGDGAEFAGASRDLRIAFGAATFAEILRGSPYVSEVRLTDVAAVVEGALRPGVAEDLDLLEQIHRAEQLSRSGVAAR